MKQPPAQSDADRLASLGLHPVWLAAPAEGVKNSGKAPLGGPGWNAHPWDSVAPRQPFPGANLGVQTGYVDGAPVQVVVLDCDSPAAIAWADAHVPPTPVRTVTGKGEHRYYRRPVGEPGSVGGRVKLTLPDGTKLDVDVKGDGGQCVAAPSIHFTGHQYSEATEWSPELLAAMPTWSPEWVGGRTGAGRKGPRLDSDTLVRPGLSQAAIRARVRWVLGHVRDFGPNLHPERTREALGATLDGSSPMAATQRGSALLGLTFVLAKNCPEATTDDLVEYITPALQAFGEGWESNSDWGLPGVRAKLESARRKLADDDAQRLATLAPVQRGTKGEAAQAEAPPADVAKLLVITHPQKEICWVRKPDGTYREIWSWQAAYQYRDAETGLHWAAELGLADWWKQGPKGPTPITREQFFAKYSTPLEPSRHKLSLLATANTFDPATGTMVEAVCPLRRDIEPGYSAELDEWFRIFAGTEYPRFIDWLATIIQLDRPTPILAVIGEPNSGKGLLIEGVSRLWHRGRAPSFAHVVGNFNEPLAKSPLLIADEYMPESGPNGSDIFEFLRELVTARTHTVNRKGLPVTQVEGCVRLVYASNKPDGLNIRNANNAAKAALAERFVYLKPGTDSVAHLARLPRSVTESWVESDIAAHCLWLAQHHRVSYGGRLLVEGNGSELIDIASNSRGATGHLCEALCRFLLDPRVVQNTTRDHFWLDSGNLWVATKAFEDKAAWELLVPSMEGKRYSTSQLGQALAMLATKSERIRYDGQKSNKRLQAVMHRIDLPQVFAFAKRTGMGDPEIMRATLGGAAHISQAEKQPTEATDMATRRGFDLAPVVVNSNISHIKSEVTSASTVVDYSSAPAVKSERTRAVTKPATPSAKAKQPAKREPKAPKAPKAPKGPKWLVPAAARSPEYAVPQATHPMVVELARRLPATAALAREVCQPFLAAAQPPADKKATGGAHPMTYGRLVLAQRAYVRAIAKGEIPERAVIAADDAFCDKPGWPAMNAPVGETGGPRE